MSMTVAGSYGQTSEENPFLTKSDIPEANINLIRTFSGESLYGYINGGADLYLEYGFQEATVTEFTVKKNKYKVEIYRMKDPESAFGIFTVSRFRCSSKPDFARLTCFNRYQLQVCRSKFYISIINESGTPADSAISAKVGKILSDRIGGPDVDIAGYIPDVSARDLLENSHTCFVKGRLGIMNGTPDLEGYFRGHKDYSALLIDNSDNYFVSLKFSSPLALEEFGHSHGWDNEISEKEFIKMTNGDYVRKISGTQVMIIVHQENRSPLADR